MHSPLTSVIRFRVRKFLLIPTTSICVRKKCLMRNSAATLIRSFFYIPFIIFAGGTVIKRSTIDGTFIGLAGKVAVTIIIPEMAPLLCQQTPSSLQDPLPIFAVLSSPALTHALLCHRDDFCCHFIVISRFQSLHSVTYFSECSLWHQLIMI